MLSQETIAAVEERTDLVALVRETVKLEEREGKLVGPCPFHPDEGSSFGVTPERRFFHNVQPGFFHCAGCKEAGGAIGFYVKVTGLPYADAVRALAKRAGIEVSEIDLSAPPMGPSRFEALEERLAKLEKRIEKLEGKPAPSKPKRAATAKR